jgi:cell division protein DivIC
MTRQVKGDAGSASTKPNNGSSRKRIRLVTLGVLALTVWAGFKAWDQMKNLEDKAGRMDALETKLTETQKVNDQLKREMERLSDPEYREEMMRKDLHLSKKGETVFDVPRANP